jgi:NADPH:quinone reductase
MKAFALESADRPAGITTVPRPEIGARDVAVAVRAASLNGFDVFQASGALIGMMEHALPTIIGRDFAGVVDAIGSSVSTLAVGDEVFGFIPSTPPLKSGSFAEFVVGGDELVLAPLPATLDFIGAAGLPLAGSAALDLLDAIDGHDGDVVLIVGATGGVGSLTVQLAVGRGLTVIATARPNEDAFMRGLGAADTIDYSTGSVADAFLARYPDGVHGLIDLVNRGDALTALSQVVHGGGRVASLLGAADADQLATRDITGINVNATPTTEKLRLLGELATSEALRVPIQDVYELDQAGEALEAFQRGTRGKIVVKV